MQSQNQGPSKLRSQEPLFHQDGTSMSRYRVMMVRHERQSDLRFLQAIPMLSWRSQRWPRAARGASDSGTSRTGQMLTVNVMIGSVHGFRVCVL